MVEHWRDTRLDNESTTPKLVNYLVLYPGISLQSAVTLTGLACGENTRATHSLELYARSRRDFLDTLQ